MDENGRVIVGKERLRRENVERRFGPKGGDDGISPKGMVTRKTEG